MLGSLLLILIAPMIGVASAGGFEAKTMRDSLAAREVERPLVIGKGWLEAGLEYAVKDTNGYWDSDGNAQTFENANWQYSTQSLTLRYGISRRAELWWRLPTHSARLTNKELGTDTSTFGMGDPSFGYRLEIYRSSAPTASIMIETFYKAPAADDSAGNFIGGPNTFTNIILTTGTPDFGVGLQGKRQVGPFAVILGARYTHRFAAAVGYLIETEYHQFQARIKPGDLIEYDAEFLLQLGPVALNNKWFFTQRMETRMGTASDDLFGVANLTPVEGSDGASIDTQLGALVNITRGVDLSFNVRRSVSGEDLQFFPIEPLHPTRGTTYSTALELRY